VSTVSLEVTGTREVISKLEELPARMQVSARSTLDAWAVQLAGYIKATKLSGDPLNRRSGRLSSSVHPVSETTADAVSAGAGGGAGVPYAHIHEYGGTIHHPGGTAFFISQLLGGRAFFVSNASALAATLPRTQPHDIPMPERSYMRSGFRDQAPDGISQLRAAVKEGLVA
jgi:phage gpG-like protein